MAESVTRAGAHVGKWWQGFAVALFLLIPVDLLTTLMAVWKYGMGVEANPVMRWLLDQGLVAVGLVNVVVACLAAYLFHTALGSIRRAPSTYQRPLTHVVNAWLAVLIAGGLLLVGNNLLAVL